MVEFTPIPEGFSFPSESAERAVWEYRNRKSVIVDAAITLNEDLNQDELFDDSANRKKLQHHYFTFLSRKEIKDFESDIVQLGTPHDKYGWKICRSMVTLCTSKI